MNPARAAARAGGGAPVAGLYAEPGPPWQLRVPGGAAIVGEHSCVITPCG